MTTRRSNLIGCLAVASITCSACDRNPTSSPPPATTVQDPKPAPVIQSASAAPAAPRAPVSTKPDKVDAASLKAGLSAMESRVVSSVEGYSKVSPNERSRFFMHPGETKTASIEFDTKGLKSLELAPFIEDLSPDQGC